MINTEAIVNSTLGLHAKPIKTLIEVTKKFQSLVEIEYKGFKADGKSLVSLLSLGVGEGEKIRLIISGIDEEEAKEEILKTIESI